MQGKARILVALKVAGVGLMVNGNIMRLLGTGKPIALGFVLVSLAFNV